MKEVIYTIESNVALTDSVYRMVMAGDTSAITGAGQFVNVKLDGQYLRRPISICDYDENTLTLIYKVVGVGTEKMSAMRPGEKLNILTGLGNGYDLSLSGDAPVLVGGGVGVPPLYKLCKLLKAEGKKVTVILGFNTKSEIFAEKDFAEIADRVIVTTVDGSYGVKGFVTNALPDIDYTYVYSCGPLPMLKALAGATETSGQYSLEERMGCGFGACMGCSCKTLLGNKRICKEGPVFVKEEIIW
ncbi:MAG: dihydroorotate dehydrogenase electron transfer subunit [Ruminococcaceae bacterium]|nr:dihydroorotate dehydrogenase electron transfer subunit [Oscillospiraceae bacterium]